LLSSRGGDAARGESSWTNIVALATCDCFKEKSMSMQRTVRASRRWLWGLLAAMVAYLGLGPCGARGDIFTPGNLLVTTTGEKWCQSSRRGAASVEHENDGSTWPALCG
jgi:hypothetical protein